MVPLSKNNDWIVTLNSSDAKDKLKMQGTLEVKGKTFKVRSADKRNFTARVHWAPVYITNSDVRDALSKYAEVSAIKHEMSTDAGFEEVAMGVRTVVMVGDRYQLPHFLPVIDPDTDERWDLLVTIPGRAPLYLKCKHTGHVRRDCAMPYCRHHGTYGHTTVGCSAEKAEASKKSYVSAVQRKITIDLEPCPRLFTNANADEEPTGPYNPPRSDSAPIGQLP